MWTAISEQAGLYTADKQNRAGWHWRTTALRLPDGGSLVVGPIAKLGDDAHRSLEEQVGRPRFVLAPNYFHYLAVPEYLERYPDLTVVASELAAPRIAKKLALQIDSLELLRSELPDTAKLLCPPGLKNGETWLRLETPTGIIWIVSDAFFNLDHNARGFMGLVLTVTGTAPGLRLGRTFTTLAVKDKRPYREWLAAQIDKDQPTTLVPGHGSVLADQELADRLLALVARRLGTPGGR